MTRFTKKSSGLFKSDRAMLVIFDNRGASFNQIVKEVGGSRAAVSSLIWLLKKEGLVEHNRGTGMYMLTQKGEGRMGEILPKLEQASVEELSPTPASEPTPFEPWKNGKVIVSQAQTAAQEMKRDLKVTPESENINWQREFINLSFKLADALCQSRQ